MTHKTFKQFISEEEIKHLAEVLKRDCAPYLKQAGGQLMFRGVKNFGTPVDEVMVREENVELYKKTIRDNRQPMSMSSVVHNYIDDWFDKKMGIRPRGSAMFCYGEKNLSRAAGYGQLAVVFPIGDFETVWGDVEDLYLDFDDFEITRQSSREDVEAVLGDLSYVKGDLSRALDTKSEIMIVGKSYYLIPCDDDLNILTKIIAEMKRTK